MTTSTYVPTAAASSALNGVGLFIMLLLFVIVLIAWLVSINLFVKAYRDKGYNGGSGLLWFVGIFATPIVVGLYVTALPDKSEKAWRPTGVVTNAPNDLPEL